MRKNKAFFIGVATIMVFALACLMAGCSDKKGGASDAEKHAQRGDPVLRHDVPVYDEATQTFSLTAYTDSTAGATLTFTLLEGDSVVMTSNDGHFSGITPFDEGYGLRLEVQWSDTTIVRVAHVMEFVMPHELVEKMTALELTKLINSCDRGIRRMNDPHLAQAIKLTIVGSSMKSLPQMLPDVVTLIKNGVWQGIEVTALDYDDKNLITSITLKPIGEQMVVVDEEDEDYDY